MVATLVLATLVSTIPNKHYITKGTITDRAVVGSHVVFVVDGQLKSYNDIETMRNMNSVRFRKSTSVNIFGYNVGETIEKEQMK